MPNSRTLLASLAALAGAAACADEQPRSPARIDDLRLLAIRAEPPEVAPGDEVHLEVLAVDPEGRPITVTWFACVLPEPGFGPFAGGGPNFASGAGGYGVEGGGTCADPAALRHVALGTGMEVDLTVPADLLDDSAVVATAFGLPDGVELPEEAELPLFAFAGVSLTVYVTVEVEGRLVDGYKRVNVSLSGDPNLNPDPPSFDIAKVPGSGNVPLPEPVDAEPPGGGRCFAGEDAATLAVGPGEWSLTALNVPDPPVTYAVLVGGESGNDLLELTENEETLFYSFFSTTGSFASEVLKSTAISPTNRWRFGPLDPASPGDEVPIWIVVRDGRGGTDWCASELLFVP